MKLFPLTVLLILLRAPLAVGILALCLTLPGFARSARNVAAR